MSSRDHVCFSAGSGTLNGRMAKDELREIVAELIAAYSDPDLQRKIRDIYET